MAMSSDKVSDLFKLAENAAPDENRLMPAERTYKRTSETVSVEEAVALLQKRKKNPDLRIKGGLDDNSDAVRKNTRKKDVKAPIADEAKVEQGDLFKPVEQKQAQASSHKGRVTTSEIMGALSAVSAGLADLKKKVGAVPPPAKAEPVKERMDPLSEFKSSEHSVTFMINGMEFTVKCLNRIKDTELHTVVFVFPDKGDSFFTPPLQSELKVKYDGVEDSGTLYYFGMCFTVEKLGLKFLGFIYYDGSGK